MQTIHIRHSHTSSCVLLAFREELAFANHRHDARVSRIYGQEYLLSFYLAQHGLATEERVAVAETGDAKGVLAAEHHGGTCRHKTRT